MTGFVKASYKEFDDETIQVDEGTAKWFSRRQRASDYLKGTARDMLEFGFFLGMVGADSRRIRTGWIAWEAPVAVAGLMAVSFIGAVAYSDIQWHMKWFSKNREDNG